MNIPKLLIHFQVPKSNENIDRIHKCPSTLVVPFKFIFTISILTDMFPDRWKTYKITVIFKSCTKSVNYSNAMGVIS